MDLFVEKLLGGSPLTDCPEVGPDEVADPCNPHECAAYVASLFAARAQTVNKVITHDVLCAHGEGRRLRGLVKRWWW